jgi:uncharacterized protein (TIGR02001 family)
MKNMKKIFAVATLLAAVPATTLATEISGNVSLTSDYRFRGISQSDTQLAVQGGFDIAFENGLYVGVWGSNVDFGSGAAPDLELDYYAGFSGDISENVSFDVGYIYYDYPGSGSVGFAPYSSEGFDYEEIYASVSCMDFTLGAAYSDDYWLGSGDFYYIYGDYSYALPMDISLDLHYGLNNFDNASGDTDAEDAAKAFLSDDEDSYADWSIGLTKAFAGVDVSVTYVDTNLSSSDVFGTNWADSTVVVAISKSL